MGLPALPFDTVLLFDKESTYGTFNMASPKIVEINTEGIEREDRKITSPSVFSIGTKTGRAIQGSIAPAGDVVFNPVFGGWLLLLKQLLGFSSSAVVVDKTKHTFKPITVLPTGLSFEIQKGLTDPGALKTAFKITGAKVDQMTFSVTAEELMEITMSIMAKDIQEITAGLTANPAFPTQKLILAPITTLKWDGGELDVSDVSLTISNNLNERFLIGDRLRKEPVRGGKHEVSGSFTAEFQTLNEWNNFKKDERKELIIIATEVVSGADDFVFEIKCPIARLDTGTPLVGGPEPIVIEHAFTAYRGAADEDEIEINVTNDNSDTVEGIA